MNLIHAIIECLPRGSKKTLFKSLATERHAKSLKIEEEIRLLDEYYDHHVQKIPMNTVSIEERKNLLQVPSPKAYLPFHQFHDYMFYVPDSKKLQERILEHLNHIKALYKEEDDLEQYQSRCE